MTGYFYFISQQSCGYLSIRDYRKLAFKCWYRVYANTQLVNRIPDVYGMGRLLDISPNGGA